MSAILFRIGIGGLALAMTLGSTSGARAETLTYKVALKSADEVPPNASSGSGTADVTYDTQTKKLSWKVSYSGLTGPATAAHFHGPAEPGKNAGVMIPIQNIGTSPAEGSATLTDAQAADLMGGRFYVNVHTAANPGGEIRGQVKK
jgi:CHRD domain